LLGRHRTCTKLPCSAFSILLEDKSPSVHEPRLRATFRMSSDETLRVLRYARYPYISCHGTSGYADPQLVSAPE
jgi:hypothetical protein